VAKTQASGEQGEREVVDLVACPNCAKPLMQLPKNYPLYDVQCTGCSFRAQVKTVTSMPKDEVLGAGWEILSKVVKSGFLIPPLLVNFKWPKASPRNQEIRFYPFVPKSSIVKYQLSPQARRANYRMFKYRNLTSLPHFVVYSRNVNGPYDPLQKSR
jgi:DNA-directed RNA polymerase subunit RPC12/RpoP